MSQYDLVTFDVYSALFDIAGSLVPILAKVTGLPEPKAKTAFGTWRAKQLERAAISNSLGKGRTSFREATRQGLVYLEHKFNLTLSSEEREILVRAWDHLNPWPEANNVITALKQRGYRTAVLSNGDQAMLEAVVENAALSFDHIFSSERAGYYKPHPAVYTLPGQALGMKPDQVLHVAGGATDALGAAAAGLPCAWSNRHDDYLLDPRFQPSYAVTNLEGLLTIL
jgi:2-haloacid dehalogenase